MKTRKSVETKKVIEVFRIDGSIIGRFASLEAAKEHCASLAKVAFQETSIADTWLIDSKIVMWEKVNAVRFDPRNN